jgi:CDGSH-type Zn-finger protein
MVKVTIIKNGPALIESTSELIEISGTDIKPNDDVNKIALCRCGKSSNGVYCDGSHKPKKEEDGK